jgi:hypothetical protein
MGAAIECFDGARAIEVRRNRFSPVKTTADLLAVRSDAYEMDAEFRLELRPERNAVPPVVKLGDDYKLVDQLEQLVTRGVPSLVRCNALTIEGKMEFDPEVEIVGDVKFIARGKETRRVLSGTYQDGEFVL